MDLDIAETTSDFIPQRAGQQPTEVLPWAIEPDLVGQLWQLSEGLTGIKFNG